MPILQVKEHRHEGALFKSTTHLFRVVELSVRYAMAWHGIWMFVAYSLLKWQIQNTNCLANCVKHIQDIDMSLAKADMADQRGGRRAASNKTYIQICKVKRLTKAHLCRCRSRRPTQRNAGTKVYIQHMCMICIVSRQHSTKKQQQKMIWQKNTRRTEYFIFWYLNEMNYCSKRNLKRNLSVAFNALSTVATPTSKWVLEVQNFRF